MKDAIESIERAESLLILTHHNADIDAIGSSIALYELLGGGADLGVAESISKGARGLSRDYSFEVNPSLKGYDLIVVLDCPSEEQLEPLDLSESDAEKTLIDHHSPGKLEDLVDNSFMDPEARSTSEMVYEIARESGWEVDGKTATAIVCGIVADTSHLKHVGAKQFEYISELLQETEKNYSEILSILRTPVDFSERVARIKAAKRIDAHRLGKTIAVFSKVGSFEAASARSLLRLGADIAIVACPREKELRISGRCKRKLTDRLHLADDVFAPLEETIEGSAGGHDAAASSNGKNMDEEEIFGAMLERLERLLDKDCRRI